MDKSHRIALSWAQSNVNKFAPGPYEWGIKDVPAGGWAGVQDYEFFGFFPHHLVRVLRDAGYGEPWSEIEKWGRDIVLHARDDNDLFLIRVDKSPPRRP
jgi:hypothetical protein